jgi:D-amino-acid dehydrogenase
MDNPLSEQDSGRGSAVVIGAGIIGIATGLYLQRDGWQVTVIDTKGPGEGTSRGNAGLFATGHVIPDAMPDLPAKVPGMLFKRESPLSIRWRYLPRLIPWLAKCVSACTTERATRSTKALAGLLGDAMVSYEPLFQSAGASGLIRRKGVLYVYKTTTSFAAAGLEFRLKREHGIPMEILDASGIRELLPALAPIHNHGVFYPDYAHTVDPFVLAQTLGSRLAQGGALFVKDEATGFSFEGDRVSAVRTAGSSHKAHIVVVAAGAYSRPLAAALGSRVPLDTERGYHVTFADPGIDLDVPVLSVDGHFLITPMTPGLRSAGLVEFAGLEAPANPALHARLMRQTQQMLPGLNTGNPSNWMGYRPAMPDSLPVISRTPRHRNAFLAFGHGHIGLSTAAATGHAIADLAADRLPQFDLVPFRADRF